MKDPKHISEIIPKSVDAIVGSRNIHEKWQDAMAKLELEMEAKSVEEIRCTEEHMFPNLNPKVGTMFYCGTGGVKNHEVNQIFENTDYHNFSKNEYIRIINQGYTK